MSEAIKDSMTNATDLNRDSRTSHGSGSAVEREHSYNGVWCQLIILTRARTCTQHDAGLTQSCCTRQPIDESTLLPTNATSDAIQATNEIEELGY